MTENRVRQLSSKYQYTYLLVVKTLLASLPVSVVLLLVFSVFQLSDLLFLSTWPVFGYILYKRLKIFVKAWYDDNFLYVQRRTEEFEIQVPHYRVKNVELRSLDGVYHIKLMDKDQFGDELLCKPSILYPFNYKKVDKKLDELRHKVIQSKKKHAKARQTEISNQLPGIQI